MSASRTSGSQRALLASQTRPPDRPPRPRRRALPRLYSKAFLTLVLRHVALLLALIEAIFLAENLNHILETAISRSGSFLDILYLMSFRSPEIFGLAMPLALMAALYRVALQGREQGELVIISGMGIGIVHSLRLAAGLGACGMLVSLLISGAVEPQARFEQRKFVFGLQYTATEGSLRPKEVYLFDRFMVYVHPGPLDGATPPTFIYEKLDDTGSTYRVFDAREARVQHPAIDGMLALALNEFVMAEFRPADNADSEVAPTMLRVGSFQQAFEMDDLARLEPRGYFVNEWNFADLLGFTSLDAPWTITLANEIGRRLARGLLCLVAPLIAILGLSFTRRGTRSFVLPAACAAIMIVDLSWIAMVQSFAQWGVPAMFAILLANAGLLFGFLFKVCKARESTIVKPALSRS